MKFNKRIVIVGATSSIAHHCARLWVNGVSIELILVGRNIERLDRVALDLKVRSPNSEIRVVLCDFVDTEAIQVTVNRIFKKGDVDIVLIAHGSLPEQSDCETSLQICRENLEINGLSPVLFAEAFAMHMSKANHGTLALIGSVAGDKGRKSNYVYGSSKGMVERYCQGLQHRFFKTDVKIILIKPGPTLTPMTAHINNIYSKMASVESVAHKIVDAISAGKSVAYIPFKWRIIMMIIRHLPNFIFNRLGI